MNLYKANGNKQFDVAEGEAVTDSSLVKLKVSSVYVSPVDVDIYQGKIETKYPIVPGHMATAIVSEDREDYGLKRGTKVILNPYILSSVDSEGFKMPKRYGVDANGFLGDFIAVPGDNVIPFPDDVKENEALFIEAIALSLAGIHAMHIEKGEYVAIVGDSVITNIMAQLVQYYQGIPILVLRDARHIAIAEKCGIYYIVNETNEDVALRVKNITGGRMANHTFVLAKPGVTGHFAFTLTRCQGDAVFFGLTSNVQRMEVDVSGLIKKEISLKGVFSGEQEIISAVNFLAQKQLKLQYFIDKTVNLADAKELFDRECEDIDAYVAGVIKA